MRKEKNGNRYFSFNEVAQAIFNLSPFDEGELKNESKRQELQDKFESKHKCNFCGQVMTYKGGNIMACTNPECAKQGFHILDSKGKSLAVALYKTKGE